MKPGPSLAWSLDPLLGTICQQEKGDVGCADITYDAFIESNCDYLENTFYYALLFLREAIRVDFVVYKFVSIQNATCM